MNDTIVTKNYRKLTLQVSQSGLSFCCLDTINWELLACKHFTFDKYKPAESQLWQLFVENAELTKPYDEITVLHDNSFNTFVPAALFDENYLGSYLQYNTKVFETDFFAFDALEAYGMHNVYVPLMNVNNFLIDQFGTFEYKNVNSILVGKLLEASKNIDEKQVYVHVQTGHFEIVVAQNQKLVLFNSFEYSTAEDFLYYLLFTVEQLMLNPETAKVWLLGAINENDELFAIAYKYIRNVALYDASALAAKYSITKREALQQFILLQS